ncbi:hypothetical protein JB92DRAFT_2835047 [Gautieria morchelliformis]|nr:hypothetical protein JB92DRAFT_2835047 [Gautieria morchelliformis]
MACAALIIVGQQSHPSRLKVLGMRRKHAGGSCAMGNLNERARPCLLRIQLDVAVVNDCLSTAWRAYREDLVKSCIGEDGRHGRVGGLNAQNRARTALDKVSGFPADYRVTLSGMGTLYSDDNHGMHLDTYNFA